ncbi:MAG: Crp/Fnr family transcriptional regulator [Clostridiales bacterium]|nr:Crp/Fnr family transcriptional regulator [Clostridiales bacterium]
MGKRDCGCNKCIENSCARKVPILSMLDEGEADFISDLVLHRNYSKGSMIYMEGDSLESLVIINEGSVKVFSYTHDGKEQILYIFSQGDFFGERNLMKSHKSPYYVEALEDTQVCMINKKDFEALLIRHPGIGLKIIDELNTRLERLEDTVKNMGTKTVESRISATLAEFAGKYGVEQKDGILVELPLSREGIANYIGLTRETVSRKLGLMQDDGIIEMIGNKKILIRKVDSLREKII